MSMSPHLVGHIAAAKSPGSCTGRHEDGERLWVYGEDHTKMARALQRGAEILCGSRKPEFTKTGRRDFSMYHTWIGQNVYVDVIRARTGSANCNVCVEGTAELCLILQRSSTESTSALLARL